MAGSEPLLLEVRGLSRLFGGGRDWLLRPRPVVRAVDDVSFSIARGRTLGLVGGSGSGKSTVARMVVGLLAPSSGRIRIAGEELATLGTEGRRKLQLVFQDPVGSLNPRKRVASIIEGSLEALTSLSRDARVSRRRELMDMVGLGPQLVERFPHDLSGGQAQRVAIARALAAGPELLVLDEPVSALDVSIQAQVLQVLRELQERLQLAYLFIGHDLAVVETLADEVAVMHRGRIVEAGPTTRVFHQPQHAYTRELIQAVPSPAV
jgi:peptide/nickel transport system ATP-binding protein